MTGMHAACNPWGNSYRGKSDGSRVETKGAKRKPKPGPPGEGPAGLGQPGDFCWAETGTAFWGSNCFMRIPQEERGFDGRI